MLGSALKTRNAELQAAFFPPPGKSWRGLEQPDREGVKLDRAPEAMIS